MKRKTVERLFVVFYTDATTGKNCASTFDAESAQDAEEKARSRGIDARTVKSVCDIVANENYNY